MRTTRAAVLTAGVWFLLISACIAPHATASPPPWLQDHLNGRLTLSGVYYGVSFADYSAKAPDYETMRLAKDRALDELCYQLSVSLRSEFENRLQKRGHYEEEQIASSLLVTSRKVLSGVTEKDRYTDSRSRRHWVLLTIARSQADRQMEQQKFINEVTDRLEHRQDEIRDGVKRIALVLDRQMAVYNEQMEHYGRLLNAIDQKVGAADDRSRQEYEQIRDVILRLETRQQAVDEQMRQQSNRQQEQITQLVEQNRQLQEILVQLADKVRQDYFLALTSDDLKNSGQNPDFSVSIRPEKGQGAIYRHGEKIRFQVKASRDCYIKVIYLSSTDAESGGQKKMNTLLFPNPHDRDNHIEAGRARIVGRYDELEVQAPYGRDVITVMASVNQFTDVKQLTKTGGGFYTEVTTDTQGAIQMRTRGISVVATAGASSGTKDPNPAALASDTCLIVSRP
ncbi:MAG: hypothetical protein AMJ54_15725 [Deltaproteobacteria bacterium SG8_13]|nr:MAG: hypothetical protein AMJ54_15725 [Deltaproteobacteria bacterium SG8_13]